MDHWTNYFAGLTTEELTEIISSGDTEASIQARAWLQFSRENDNIYIFGWDDSNELQLEVDPAYIFIPPDMLAEVGVPDNADDRLEITPEGSPARLSGVRISWPVYNPSRIKKKPVILSADGTRWELSSGVKTNIPTSIYNVLLPAQLAERISDSEPVRYQIKLNLELSE